MRVCVCAACCAPRAHLGPGFSRDKGMLISSLYCSLLSRTSSHAWTWHSGMRQRELLVATSLSPVGECNVPSRERGGRGGEGEGNKSITPRSPLPASPSHCARRPRQKFPAPPAAGRNATGFVATGCLVPSPLPDPLSNVLVARKISMSGLTDEGWCSGR